MTSHDFKPGDWILYDSKGRVRKARVSAVRRNLIVIRNRAGLITSRHPSQVRLDASDALAAQACPSHESEQGDNND